MSSYTNINLNNYLNYNFGNYQLNLCGGDHLPDSLLCEKEKDSELSSLLEPVVEKKTSEASWTMSPDKFKLLCVALENKAFSCDARNKKFDDTGVSRTLLPFKDGKNWVLTVIQSGPAL